MRNTVNRTLSEALSENVATLTARMRALVQSDADALGLGVEVMAFTVGGMHPPVMVAADYQGVVSAELGKVAAVVDAQAFRNQTVPVSEHIRPGDNVRQSAHHPDGFEAIFLNV
jgi:regulator of protease activity HflC (stomatin/prohibitin superfamily)